ncbi:hypothetical protein DQ04_03551070 [Trypanosoma grayi]|uniref:hypothetical protein n=1 Tax=Trypanosoma grayi TaxID=71804 RepID=UPI0004F465CC|nr:hypothetical protein DQ04_03551070 [Trypanosoma grayi]KEG10576.1 hypothetical protein DQ04_03551070 [Trypanosoma grayi]
MPGGVNCRRDITLLASKGCYGLAREAEEARQRHIAESKIARRQELLKQHEIQWKAFQEAKNCRLEDARVAITLGELQAKEALHRKYSAACEAHDEEMEAYLLQVTCDEARRPVTLSPLVPMLRTTEKRLASVGRYAEAAHAQAVGDDVEKYEREAAQERQIQVMERKLREKQKELGRRSASSYRKVLVAQQLNSQRAVVEMQAVEANLQHKAMGMAVTHKHQRRALELPLLESRAFTKAEALRAARGTQLKRAVHGDHYHVPSLCTMYGGLLDHD